MIKYIDYHFFDEHIFLNAQLISRDAKIVLLQS